MGDARGVKLAHERNKRRDRQTLVQLSKLEHAAFACALGHAREKEASSRYPVLYMIATSITRRMVSQFQDGRASVACHRRGSSIFRL